MHLTCSHTLTETFLSNLPSSPPPSLCLPPSSETFLCLSCTALRRFIRSQRALQIPPHPFYNIQLFSQQKHERIKQNMKPLSYSKNCFPPAGSALTLGAAWDVSSRRRSSYQRWDQFWSSPGDGRGGREKLLHHQFVSHRLWKLQAAQLKLCLT